jgi:uncharacterized RDD family membrane protein YckC
MEYGGFWIRFAAYIIDSIIATVLYVIVLFILWAIGVLDFGAMAALDAAGQAGAEPDPADVFAALRQMGLIYLFVFLVLWLYEALLNSSSMQATPGKMVFGLRVTTLDGQRIGFGRATGRFFGKIVSGMIAYVGFIMVAFTERKQGLHDMMASTLVVRG